MEPRPAATVVLACDAAEGVTVAVLRRAAGNRFAPGFVVFPGGAEDEGDAALAAGWFGNASEARRACAVRELAEETSLALTRAGVRPASDPGHALRLVSDDPPAPASLVEVGRWVAPEALPVRFDAAFFAVRAGVELRMRPDGVEDDRAWWARPAAVLESGRLYESLMWPTYRMLEALAGCRSVEEVLRLHVQQEPAPAHGSERTPEWGHLRRTSPAPEAGP